MDDKDFLENPAMANWPTLANNRKIFDADVGVDVKLERMRLNRDKKTGAVTITGGPKIKILGDFRYQTASGKMKPFGQTSLFTWTSKMSCPSFSIPAGPERQGGTCPASLRSTIIAEGSYTEFHPPLEDQPEGQAFICDVCYAGKGRYLMYKSMSFRQVANWTWVNKTVRDSSFARRMTEAIEYLKDERIEEMLLSQLVSNRYFRIHDSGDWSHPEYYKGWVDVCRNLPNVHFWAPTRMWVFAKWRKLFTEYPPPENMTVRPSALFTSAPPPSIPGLAEGSTSIEGRMDAPVWNCPAYEGENEHSCAAARCRVCWDAPKKPVNYLTH